MPREGPQDLAGRVCNLGSHTVIYIESPVARRRATERCITIGAFTLPESEKDVLYRKQTYKQQSSVVFLCQMQTRRAKLIPIRAR